jgi:hypothetical protein
MSDAREEGSVNRMPDAKGKILGNYHDVLRLVANAIGAEATENDHQYYPFWQEDSSKGFLELIFPFSDSAGRFLRGAAGNGPIFIFLYCRGTWTFMGEMHGATVTPQPTNSATELLTYIHVSATAGIVCHYQLCDSEYRCTSEEDAIEE